MRDKRKVELSNPRHQRVPYEKKEADRRDVLKSIGAACGVISLSALSLNTPALAMAGGRNSGSPAGDVVRLGVISDLHGGLAGDAESRLDVFINEMSGRDCDALVQLGDFAYPDEKHQQFADKFNAAHDATVHVIGNHEFDFNLTREDCFRAWGIESAYYVRDVAGIRLIVLDGNEQGSPSHRGGYPSYIGKEQQEWLASQLEGSSLPVLILSHQPLAGRIAIDNAVEVQQLLSGFREKILLCLNGHSHVDCLLQVQGVNYLHVNSASYYWVGGETRMAEYVDPLFSMLTIDRQNETISIEGAESSWRGASPASIGYFNKDNAPPETIVVPAIRQREINSAAAAVRTSVATTGGSESIRIMTWNIWGRLNQDPRYTIDGRTARQRTVEIIRESGADVVAMVETYGSAEAIAGELGFHYTTPSPDANLCIFSRYPLTDVEPLSELSAFSFIAATVNLPTGKKVRVYDIWLTSSGRHIVEIKNEQLSDNEFNAGDSVRFEQLEEFLNHEDLNRYLAGADEVPVVVAGDFNCVSHLDYTTGTRHSGLNQGRVIPAAVSKAMHRVGFSDTFRMTNPDILASTLGHTWTTVGQGFVYESGNGFVPVDENPEPEYRDPYARIDYIYSCGARLEPVSSSVITHHPMSSAPMSSDPMSSDPMSSDPMSSDRSFPEFPSDHAAVITHFIFRD